MARDRILQIYRGTTAQNDAFTGAIGELTMDTTNNEIRIHDGSTVGGHKIGGSSGSAQSVGNVFWTMRTDNELHGAVECNGATYNTTDFTGDGSIGELLEAGKLDYISLTDYATAISTKGWCDKIGWNGAGTTSFRVPTLTPRIIQTNNIPVFGNGMVLGLTNGTGNYGLDRNGESGSWLGPHTSSYGQPVTSSGSGITGAGAGKFGITTDGTKSGIIADTSDTAQLRVMIQLFNGTTDEAVATVGGVLADVAANKAAIAGADYVVESQEPTAANNYTWYRKYKSGWVEQGGWLNTNGGTISFPIPMSLTNQYTAIAVHNGNTAKGEGVIHCFNKTSTSMQVGLSISTSGMSYFSWLVSGMAAN